MLSRYGPVIPVIPTNGLCHHKRRQRGERAPAICRLLTNSHRGEDLAHDEPAPAADWALARNFQPTDSTTLDNGDD